MSITKRYANGEIVVVWKPGLCSHSTICFQGLPAVFDPRERPWVRVAAAPTEAIVRTGRGLPVGRAVVGARSSRRSGRGGDGRAANAGADHGPPERPAGGARRPGGDLARWHRRGAAEGGVVLPMRPFCQQAVLRRLARPRGFRRLTFALTFVAERRRTSQPRRSSPKHGALRACEGEFAIDARGHVFCLVVRQA